MSESIQRLAALGLIVSLVVAACGDDTVDSTSSDEPAATASSTATPSLDGREFVSTDAYAFQLVDGSVIRLSFETGNLSASGGCNQMQGAYTVESDVLVVDELAMTQMACDPALMDQDQRLVELLTTEPTIELADDTLTISSGSSSITFLDVEVADPDRTLEGVRWMVDTVFTGSSASTVPTGAVASMTIVDGVAEVETGCNNGSAPVTITATTLTFGPMSLTRKACPPELTDLENTVVATLTGEVPYTIEADVLTLMNGSQGLGFLAEPA